MLFFIDVLEFSACNVQIWAVKKSQQAIPEENVLYFKSTHVDFCNLVGTCKTVRL